MESMDMINTSKSISIPNKPSSETNIAISYKECKKNHATAIGGYALDGCGEFMSSDVDPFNCAACGCHRNFHRQEISLAADVSPEPLCVTPISCYPPNVVRVSGGGNGSWAGAMHEAERFRNPKRFRTSFSAEQKEKMHGFAEEVGWKLVKENDEKVMEFCDRVGVKRGVFKVWMHNNKGSRSNKDDDDTGKKGANGSISSSTGVDE